MANIYLYKANIHDCVAMRANIGVLGLRLKASIQENNNDRENTIH